MNVDLQNIFAAMQKYQHLNDTKPDNAPLLTPEMEYIRKNFAEIGFRIGIDEYGNVALYLKEMAHPNVFGAM